MSDDLVKRFSSYNVMMMAESGKEVPTPSGDWVKYKDYKDTSDHIEELEAKLAKAVEALEFIDGKISWEINPSNYDHDQVCKMNADWCEIGNYAEVTLKELKGQDDE